MTTVGEFMTTGPLTMPASAMVTDAARQMRDADIGDVIVAYGDEIRGIVTDRDIAVRCVAEDLNPAATAVGEIISDRVVTVNPHDDAVAAADLMRTYAVRRLPVVEDGRLVGVVTLGDLAVEREPDSVLADISVDDPNN